MGVFCWDEVFLKKTSNIYHSLAWAEVELILAKIFWSFDLELSERSPKDWTHQRVYLLLEKLPLFVHLKPRVK